jgi:hypothetical protein
MFCFVSDCSKAWSTHPIMVILFGSMWLLIDIARYSTVFYVVLKGLKQDTFIGYNAYDMCNVNVIMFNLNSFACFIAYKVTSLVEKCQFVIIMYD